MRVGKNALYPAEFPVWFPFQDPTGKDYTQGYSRVLGDTVLFLWCSLASLLCSLRGVMNRSSGSSGGVL